MNLWQRTAQVLLWLGVSLYLGGLVSVGAITAPAVFNTVRAVHATSPLLPQGDDAADQVGGEIFGNVLQRFIMIEWVSIALIVCGVVIQFRLLQWRRVWGVVRASIVILLLAAAALDLLYLTPTIWRVRQEWRDSIHNAPAEAALYKQRFDLLHHQSEALGQVKVYTLLALLILVAWRSAPAAPAIPSNKGS